MGYVLKYVFTPALIAGLLLGLGLPGIEDVVYETWKIISENLIIPDDFGWQISLLGFLIFILLVLAKIEHFIIGLTHGLLAFSSAILGFIGGILITKILMLGVIFVLSGAFLATVAEHDEIQFEIC